MHPLSSPSRLSLPQDFRVALILGGARSGKSAWALRLAGAFPAPRLYVATAFPGDAEMAARIAQHQRERGNAFDTLEVQLDLPEALSRIQGPYRVVLIDCLTMWVTNVLQAEIPPAAVVAVGDGGLEVPTPLPEPDAQLAREKWQNQVQRLLAVLGALGPPVILVSNEVGWGIVPDNPLAREFRDRTGWLHQRLAAIADLVMLVVAGLPVVLKREACEVRRTAC